MLPIPQGPEAKPQRRGRRAEWAATVAVGLGMLLVPAGFAVLLDAEGGSGAADAVAADESTTRAETDRVARVTFHLRAEALGLRILRKAPSTTRALRGRVVRVMCGSVSGLVVRKARWPRREPTLQVDMPARVHATSEFCAVKRGRQAIARVVFP